ncbi:MAG: hypothetical protein FWE55_01875 [Synergistaceae bacterium]|nr:hypothetical protein [Synergistaceae bacterium]
MSGEPGGGEVLRFRASGQASAVFFTVAGAFAWVTVIYLLYVKVWPETDNIGIPLAAAIGTGALGVAVNAAALIRQLYGKKVVFDRPSRTVSISRLFSKPTVMSFQSIARVAPLTCKGLFTTREAYCLVPTIAPLFGLKIISPVCVPGGKKMESFKSGLLPEIEKILELDKDGQKRKEETPPSVPSCYMTQDACYTKSFTRKYVVLYASLAVIILAAFSAVPLLKYSGVDSGYAKAVTIVLASFTLPVALSLFLLLLLPVTSVSFDTSGNVIELRRGIWGWGGVKTYDMSLASAFEAIGNGAGLYGDGRREIYLRLEGVQKPLLLMSAASRGKASADELKFLAGLLNLDPARDMSYTLYQLTSTMFEVP